MVLKSRAHATAWRWLVAALLVWLPATFSASGLTPQQSPPLAPPMHAARSGHTATLLPNGRVLVAGGFDGTANLSSAEIYDPLTNTWVAVAPMKVARAFHAATLLPNGRVLVAGGAGPDGNPAASVEIYDPLTNTWEIVPPASTNQPPETTPPPGTTNPPPAADTVPNAFSLAPQTGVALSAVATSNSIAVLGVDAATPVSIDGGSYAVNGGAFTTASGSVNNGDAVAVRLLSSGSYSTQTCSTLDIGGVQGAFCVTTEEALAPAITSTSAATFTSGRAGIFTVTTSGRPRVGAMTNTGALPVGVTLTDHGNGTATLGGTPAVGTAGTYSFTLTASNGVVPSAVQPFTLTVNAPPAAEAPVAFALGRIADTNTPIPGGSGNFENFDDTAQIDGDTVVFHARGVDQEGLYLFDGDALRRIADRSTPIPDGSGTFVGFDPQTAISGPNVVFAGWGSSQQSGLYLFDGTMLRRVADASTPDPSGSGTFCGFAYPAISGERLLFRGCVSSGPALYFQGIYLYDLSGDGSLRRLADESTPAPGGTGTLRDFSQPVISGNTVAFGARTIISAQGNVGLGGIYVHDGTTLGRVADTSTPVPNGAGTFSLFGPPTVIGNDVVFEGSWLGGRGIYVADSLGGLNRIADTSTLIPNGTGAFTDLYATFVRGLATSQGAPRFFQGYGSGQMGIYLHDGVVLGQVADTSTPIPNGIGTFEDFTGGAIGGALVLAGQGGSGQEGIYFYDGRTLTRVVDKGTPLPGASGPLTDIYGAGLRMSATAIVFQGERALVDGTPVLQGVYLARPFSNHKPLAVAAALTPAEATGSDGATVLLDGTGSSDPDGNTLTYTWREGETIIGTGSTLPARLSIGTHTIVMMVDDGYGETASADVTVNVLDTTAPVAQITSPLADAWLSGSSVSVTAQVADLVGLSSVIVNGVTASRTSGNAQSGVWTAVVPMGPAGGAIHLDVTALDGAGNRSVTSRQVSSPGTSPEVDTTWNQFSTTWSDARVVDAREAGAKGDAQVALDCTMAVGSTVLTCATNRFDAADIGKAIVVYGAGTPWSGTAQPLTSKIQGVVSTASIVLANPALSLAAPSPRVLWGTDDTSALQAAVDSLASSVSNNGPGGILSLPAGHFLVRELALPCARLGTFPLGTCTATYNHIWIKGAARDQTTLENWDVGTLVPGLITLGRRADVPRLGSQNARLNSIVISDLTVRQVTYPTRVSTVIWGFATEDVWIVNTAGFGYSYECYVMGGATMSVRWRVHYNQLASCGHGGPAYGGSTSALNLNGTDWIASYNVVTDSLQAVEMGSRHGTLTDNVLISPQRNSIGVNVGSTGAGIWDNTIARNQIIGFISAVEVYNSIGTVNRTSIIDNTIVNGVISVNSGMEKNSVVEGEVDTVVHGTSTVRGNTLTYTVGLFNQPIKVGTLGYGPQAGLESVEVTGNTITYTSMHLQGGTQPGQPCVANAFGGLCRLSGGFLALAAYGGAEDLPAPRAMVVATDNVLRGPSGAVSLGIDVALFKSRSDALQLLRLDANYAWKTQVQR